MVTLVSQDLSEFAIHARAVLGLPIPVIRQFGPSASKAIVVEGNSEKACFKNIEKILEEPDTHLRLFGKPEVKGHRRMGVILTRGDTIEDAREKAVRAYEKLEIEL
jgi:phosphoribosylglycinamide formyltransferase 2